LAQQGGKTILGNVADDKGEAVIGASVVAKGTSTGTVTDINGNFSLTTTPNAVLVISYLGFKTQEIAIDGRANITVTLSEDTKVLDAVVVVGYGTQKKMNLTGAISSIKSDEIMTTTNSSLAQRLQGKVSGLQIRQNSGSPGDFDNMINIRGFGTPLFVVDGIARYGGSEFQRLNPEDIESISVLKDASAAIYGLNAANGVIIVTTKSGSEKTKFTYNTTFGINSPTEMPKMASALQWMEMRNDAAINIGTPPLYSEETMALWRQGGRGYTSTDWYDATMKNFANQQSHTLSAQGGNEKLGFYVSMGYLNEN
jgi:TonB-linked SusC/RagA family outer membrane protein